MRAAVVQLLFYKAVLRRRDDQDLLAGIQLVDIDPARGDKGVQLFYHCCVDAAAIHGEIILPVAVLVLAGQVVLKLLQLPLPLMGMIILLRLRGKVVKAPKIAVDDVGRNFIS